MVSGFVLLSVYADIVFTLPRHEHEFCMDSGSHCCKNTSADLQFQQLG